MNQIQSKLSADPGALVLGIISIVIILTGCCCGLLSIPVLIMGIIGWIWAANSKKAYLANPEAFSPKSYSNVRTGLVMNMIVTILVGLLLTLGLIFEGFALFDPESYFEQFETGSYEYENEDDDVIYDDGEEAVIDEWQYEETTDTVIENIESQPVDSL